MVAVRTWEGHRAGRCHRIHYPQYDLSGRCVCPWRLRLAQHRSDRRARRQGEATLPSGESVGASITEPKLEGWIDADGDRTEEAVVTFTCFGSTFEYCCAGRSSMMKFIGVFDFSNTSVPKQVGKTIVPGSSPLRGETYGESRFIKELRIDGPTIVTDEQLIYPDSAEADKLGFSPDATVEVTHRFKGRQWTSTERVLD